MELVVVVPKLHSIVLMMMSTRMFTTWSEFYVKIWNAINAFLFLRGKWRQMCFITFGNITTCCFWSVMFKILDQILLTFSMWLLINVINSSLNVKNYILCFEYKFLHLKTHNGFCKKCKIKKGWFVIAFVLKLFIHFCKWQNWNVCIFSIGSTEFKRWINYAQNVLRFETRMHTATHLYNSSNSGIE